MERYLSKRFEDLTLVAGAWAPPVDLYETEEYLHLHAELAGVEESDIKIEVKNGVITIRGERHLMASEEQGYICAERSYGPFIRTFHLPTPIVAEEMRMEFALGVLKVILPKPKTARR